MTLPDRFAASEHTVLISVGSNLGEKLANCRKSIESLTSGGIGRLVKCSPFYQTEPVDYEDQAWFINAAVQIRTGLSPRQLLGEMKHIERVMGRKFQDIRFGPRIIDLDILLYDDLVIDADGLVVPHPRMHKRRFVLRPICDIDPNINHPVLNKSMGELLEAMDKLSQQVVEIQCDS